MVQPQPQPGRCNGLNSADTSRQASSGAPLASHGIPLLEHEHHPLRFARRHHALVPRHGDSGFHHYKALHKLALANAVRQLEQELGSRSNVHHLEFLDRMLIVRHHSQSKLSQQELADLQKATHFDKKELQQWYKGTFAV